MGLIRNESHGESVFLGLHPVIVQFRKNLAAGEDAPGLTLRSAKECWSRFRGQTTLTLPMFYLQVLISLGEAFEPWAAPWTLGDAKKSSVVQVLNPARIPGVREYTEAVKKARQCTREVGDGEMFKNLTVTPFGL